MDVYQLRFYVFRYFLLDVLQKKKMSHKSSTRNTRKVVLKLFTVLGNEVLHASFCHLANVHTVQPGHFV